jgi:hypothetical protein|tara:strand:- start:8871 stop:9110 length:240 start_codon:yes stop_codon:yes gene_type:complete
MTEKIGFLQAASGANSSRRLAFLVCQPFIILVALYLIKHLAHTEPKIAYKVFVAFCAYSSLLGGMVTSDTLLKIFGKKK